MAAKEALHKERKVDTGRRYREGNYGRTVFFSCRGWKNSGKYNKKDNHCNMSNYGGAIMSTKNKQVVMVIDDSLLICKGN